MSNIDLSWICAGGALLGNWLLAKRRHLAIYILACSSILWIVWAATHQVWSIVVLNIIYLALDVRTIHHWRRE